MDKELASTYYTTQQDISDVYVKSADFIPTSPKIDENFRHLDEYSRKSYMYIRVRISTNFGTIVSKINIYLYRFQCGKG